MSAYKTDDQRCIPRAQPMRTKTATEEAARRFHYAMPEEAVGASFDEVPAVQIQEVDGPTRQLASTGRDPGEADVTGDGLSEEPACRTKE